MLRSLPRWTAERALERAILSAEPLQGPMPGVVVYVPVRHVAAHPLSAWAGGRVSHASRYAPWLRPGVPLRRG